MRQKLTVDVLVRSWLECFRREFGGEERIFCSRRDRARLRSMAKISFDLVLSDNVRAMIYGWEEEEPTRYDCLALIDGQVRTYAFIGIERDFEDIQNSGPIGVFFAKEPRKSESWSERLGLPRPARRAVSQFPAPTIIRVI